LRLFDKIKRQIKGVTMNGRKHTVEFKTKVALEAIKEEITIAELSKKYDLHPTLIGRWKTEALSNFGRVFEGGKTKEKQENTGPDASILEQKIGQRIIENDYLKKKWEGYQNRSGGR
jgi:transposase-like protein